MRKWLSVFSLIFCSASLASGIGLHIFMAEVASTLVNSTSLSQLLQTQSRAVKNGARYPDSGYPINQLVGEFNHWQTFLNHYQDYIRANCKMPFDKNCAVLAAHFLGCAAHSIGDVNWDKVFLRQVADIMGKTVSQAQEIDYKYDSLAVVDFNRTDFVPLPYVPLELFTKFYQELGKDYTAADISAGTGIMFGVLIGQVYSAPIVYKAFRSSLPWSADHYFDADGGVLYSAREIASVWNQIWQRWSDGRNATLSFSGFWPMWGLPAGKGHFGRQPHNRERLLITATAMGPNGRMISAL